MQLSIDKGTGDWLQQHQEIVSRLARVSSIELLDELSPSAVLRSTAAFDAAIIFEKQIDPVAERERLTKELARLEKEQANAERQLGNEAFLGKAPAAVVDGLRKRAAELQQLVPKTRAAIEGLR